MTREDVTKSVAGALTSMSVQAPFLAWGIFVGTVLLGWLLYQGQSQTDKLIALQAQTSVDRQLKTAAINELAESALVARQLLHRSIEASNETTERMNRLTSFVEARMDLDDERAAGLLEKMETLIEAEAKSVEELTELRDEAVRRNAPKQ